MTKIQEVIAAEVSKGIEAARAEFTADVENRLKEISKDAIASREQANDGEKDRIKSFYKALASGDRAEMKAVQDQISKDYQAKGQTVGTSNQGGILVPVTISQSIHDKLEYVSPMRRIATVISNMPAALTLNTGSLPFTYWVYRCPDRGLGSLLRLSYRPLGCRSLALTPGKQTLLSRCQLLDLAQHSPHPRHRGAETRESQNGDDPRTDLAGSEDEYPLHAPFDWMSSAHAIGQRGTTATNPALLPFESPLSSLAASC
ncbi:phage major capsid protein [Arthrobacter sp. AK04]|uniref:phage major capsid protein n=1 Tax=Arthrobacter sp. AK04 TaxID=2900048 RepID=UPI001E3072B1|nr:phage major capsid protein [Arthrobacter sp. AK04]MCD5341531.1 phage major capsid protein [Arthrobacter sp. AK04]